MAEPVMVSSTTVDLPAHRAAACEAILRAKYTPVMMEHGSAEWNSDAIRFSLEKVEQSRVYVGIFALRYGYIPDDPVRNPLRLSVTELEYRHAVRLGKPTLIFIAKDTHPFTRAQIDFDSEKCEKLEQLKQELQKGICAFFGSAEELSARVLQSLYEIRARIGGPENGSDAAGGPRLPAPPDVYAVPNYILTSTFIGRSDELDRLDGWAKSADPLMVVEGIGGQGKSALTWEWMQNRATYAVPVLAGRVWWSFYERDASMAAFVSHALAYTTGRAPDAPGQETTHYQRCLELLAELNRRPFLLVLDGFERVLTAYHRWDKAQQRDDKVEPDLRECTDPRDGGLLRQLLCCGPSKVLISTRLFPRALEDRASRRPCTGVAYHKLNGLSRSDALAFLRQAGVRGDERAMLDFANQFGNHSLVLKVVCGEIASYAREPFDFDAWRADPVYGGKLALRELDLKQNYNHILRFALEGLDERKRTLLSRIAVLSESVTYNTLAVINPYLPPKPSPPAAGAPHARPEPTEHAQAVRAFDEALRELLDRGLVQRDRASACYDMHPVVRGHAAEFLEANDRKQTFAAVRDHFANLPSDNYQKATRLADVERSVEIYRCFVGEGLFDNAVEFLRRGLANTLYFHLGSNALVAELLAPLFPDRESDLPCVSSAEDVRYVLSWLAIVLGDLGHEDKSLALSAKALQGAVGQAAWGAAGTHLCNISVSARVLNRRAESAAALALAWELAKAAEDRDGESLALLHRTSEAIDQGRLNDGEGLLANFRARPRPSSLTGAGGSADYWSCVLLFYRGKLTEPAWRRGYELATQDRNVIAQYGFLALRAEWLLLRGQPTPALNAVDEAFKIVNRLGLHKPDYHDLRAWALAGVGSPAHARAELACGEHRLFAAVAWRTLGDRETFRACALNAYAHAWGEGPPYIRWCELECSRTLLRELGEPEPSLPLFDPGKVEPVPHEVEIRAAIVRLNAGKKSRPRNGNV